MQKTIGYYRCPDCGASLPTTHYKSCPYKNVDPRDIPSPLNRR